MKKTETADEVRHKVIKAAYRPGPMCRDCGDRNGVCHDGTKCDPFEAALDRLRVESATNRQRIRGVRIDGNRVIVTPIAGPDAARALMAQIFALFPVGKEKA